MEKQKECDGCHKLLSVSLFKKHKDGTTYSRCIPCSEKHKNRYIKKNKTLLKEFPQLCKKEWDYEKNEKGPENYAKGSNKKVWWKCKNDPCGCHIWEARIGDRTRQDKKPSGCPFCIGQKVCEHDNLLTNYPKLCREWNKDNELGPENYSSGSNKKVWWKCQNPKIKCECHVWKTQIFHRTYKEKPSGCPFCDGKKVCEHDNLLTNYSKLCKEWDNNKNEKGPENYSSGSNKKVWWKCKNYKVKCKCHVWKTQIYDRTKTDNPTGCPFCMGQKVCEHDNLLVKFPELCKEWDNQNKLGPEKYSSGSNKKVWWKCKNYKDHLWFATIYNRTNKNKLTGCPFCKESKGEKYIDIILTELKITSESQKKFKECKDKQYLLFDKYIPEWELLIEFDGEQHFDAENYYSRQSDFNDRCKKDLIKTKFAKDYGFSLLRISYEEIDYIEEIIDYMEASINIDKPSFFFNVLEVITNNDILETYEKHNNIIEG